MASLGTLTRPGDVRSLRPPELAELAQELRELLIDTVCRTGGHLGPNLGVVELTIALHRVFDSPQEPIVFDTGHQAYVHKVLTGRRAGFGTLRQQDGLSGYPNRTESRHDMVENSHASTALSYADGLSKGFALRGEHRTVVAVVGDGAMTGGLAWEALNNLGASGRPVVIVLNDNGRSYAPTVGGLPRHLRRLVEHQGYADVVARLGGTPTDDREVADPHSLFGALGLHYLGPVDGHDVLALEDALQQAREHGRPTVVHCLTRKGLGYRPAETDEHDRMHSVGKLDVATGKPASAGARSWTQVFSDALVDLGDRHTDVVALSAAMVEPTGLAPFAQRYPERCFDTGIAEQHTVTSAAGLAMAGAHPVVAVYATFLGRAFDQALLDVGLHRLPVTFVLDRAGITGPDGPSHHGIWDLAMLSIVPGMHIAAPRDATRLTEELTEAVAHTGGPTALRFPKASASEDTPAVACWRGLDLLHRPARPHVLLVAVGPMAQPALAAAHQLAERGIRCTVVDPRWVHPVNHSLADLAAGHRLVVTVEDGIREGGVGTHVAQAFTDLGCDVPVRTVGLPVDYLPHGSRANLLSRYGLDADGIAQAVMIGLEDGELDAAPLDGQPHLHLAGHRGVS
ncbi:MAG TPA: 1-deoxy-D-xylulose-5-phosphate synthase [Segeticoccus sp.]|uniref:1-deoxy-D-xylulose-5-phosphate synthase n=1 Tax=Segeticoccus sp. TaxID=2706531 RepID=UPI002D80B8D8|nr:1-deoxy-D-xylulose-5-phosphate synthase [Segeticoccus sp.]HET8600771.1 1-deoxy-D-xylulose-5-phosphate synthase [Segeticoccus sp.]